MATGMRAVFTWNLELGTWNCLPAATGTGSLSSDFAHSAGPWQANLAADSCPRRAAARWERPGRSHRRPWLCAK